MLNFMNNKLYNAQFMRVLGQVPLRAAEMGECFQVANQITERNHNLWYEQWNGMAEKNRQEGEKNLSEGLNASAYTNFLCASTYYRAAYFFLEDTPTDNRIEQALDNSIQTFLLATQFMPYNVEFLHIPYENIHLPAYLYLHPQNDEPRPIIITCAGGDGTKEEAYSIANAALSNGYHCLCFEGPGQGAVLRQSKIHLTHEWEFVAKAVIDYIEGFLEINYNKIIYFGKSFGGFLGARAITKEHRIAACILDPGQFDMISNIEKTFLKPSKKIPLEQALEDIVTTDPQGDSAFMLNSRLWRFGAKNFRELCCNLSKYTLEGLVEKIQCPVLIFDNEQEYLSKGQAKLLYDKLLVPKTYHLFRAKEMTGGHCQPLLSENFYRIMFQWLKCQLSNDANRNFEINR